ncbi:YybH family protein [Nonomuraea zeae]|uniref:DUF4440 domain-containing protein n=1 Tax=Nonomuraea zeae TaxID=1642303 RepID=A0A5S4GMN3_9ACTN|nr:nuclear transport factor 2 family protein [Nonomuraea zeae]TMR34062.1 DUF4440 domain-containing protein [Nonomuraea zeae]
MSIDATGVLVELMDGWQRAFSGHRLTELVSMFSPDALFQGVDPRLRVGHAEIREYYTGVVPGTTAVAEVLRATRPGPAIVGGFADVTFTAPTGGIRRVRLSVVAGRTPGGGWLIEQYHATEQHLPGPDQ